MGSLVSPGAGSAVSEKLLEAARDFSRFQGYFGFLFRIHGID